LGHSGRRTTAPRESSSAADTAGPLAFYLPLPSKDGKSVFAVGEQLRGQLLRYDATAKQFVPYAQSMSMDHIAFSHDGKWMAYVEFPEGILAGC